MPTSGNEPANMIYMGEQAPIDQHDEQLHLLPISSTISLYLITGQGQQGVTKRCRLSFCWPIAPSNTSPNAGGMGGRVCCGVLDNEYSCLLHVTWSPNELRKPTSIFNQWEGSFPRYNLQLQDGIGHIIESRTELQFITPRHYCVKTKSTLRGFTK